MPKIVKINLTKKIRYLFDKPPSKTPDGDLRMQDMVMDHFGSFINNSWDMSDQKRFDDMLDNSGLTIEEFLSKDWPREEPKPKRKPRKKAPTKKKAVAKKTPVKKTVRKKKA